MTTRVISMCTLKHADVWKLTSALLPKFVIADEYVVFVPEEEIEEFKLITSPRIEIASQSMLDFSYKKVIRERLSNVNNDWRYGWYVQQFYKIEAMIQSTATRVVIWDSDCVPISNIKTFDLTGNPMFMDSANETNLSYFRVIEKTLGIRKIQDMSFVIPSFPFIRKWMDEFVRDIESCNPGKTWHSAIIDNIDFSEISGFSETETLGTWMANKHKGNWSIFSGAWERRGQKSFGYAKKFTPEEIIKIGRKRNLDIISFENWDTRGFRLLIKRFQEFLCA
jgi:hypothetical protein